jgi:hypothetical protein
MMMAIFGKGVESVVSMVVRDELVTAVKYPSFHVLLNFVKTWQRYDAIVYCDGKTLARTLDGGDTYKLGLEDYYNMVHNKKQPHPLDDLVYGVKVTDAIGRSVKEGKEVIV